MTKVMMLRELSRPAVRDDHDRIGVPTFAQVLLVLTNPSEASSLAAAEDAVVREVILLYRYDLPAISMRQGVDRRY